MWPAGRIAGEALLSVLLGLLGAGSEALDGGNPWRIVAVALAAALLSPLRRALPATVLLAASVGVSGWAGFLPLVLVASWSAGRRVMAPGRAAGTFTLAYLLALLSPPLLWHFSLSSLVFGALLLLAVMVVPGLVGRYWTQSRTLADMLHEYHAQLLREREMVVGQARMRERQRIAQDMHDSLGHQLALISVHTGALEVGPGLTGRQRETVGVLREASVTAMRELREVVGLLRDGTEMPDAAEDIRAASGGADGIEGLVATSRSTGTAVELRRTGAPWPLTQAAGHAAYRIAQEGLTNAHKHAPGAPITLTLRYDTDALTVEVANGPVPAPVHPDRGVVSGGQGLAGLGERARLAGGIVHAGPTDDGGFRLAGVLPRTATEGAAPAPAPFVAPQDGLRRQFPAGSPGDGGSAAIRNGLPAELLKAVSRSRRRKGLAVGCGTLGLIAVAVVIAVAVALFRGMDSGMIERKQYDAVTVGQSEAAVRKQLPDGRTFLTENLDKGAPPKPSGSTCLSLLAPESLDKPAGNVVFRFCFKNGTLIEKKTFETAP
ncbi:sensor histidine kinase [Streptomyces pinistramenti]|uniref:sensor histidine kinase n=1 Tax=Streptomyces pinistramenti TaxID=2884812 RepID=UPI001D07007E|nr:histidine kinase [Streptomyces pinistramenti]MCB5910138.1 histidine kinase [Streptomyces pinistramenti]